MKDGQQIQKATEKSSKVISDFDSSSATAAFHFQQVEERMGGKIEGK